jgi:hypothetical protein
VSNQGAGGQQETVPRARAELAIVLLVGLGLAVAFGIDVLRGDGPRNVLVDVAGCLFVGGLWIFNVVYQVRKLRRVQAARRAT